MKNYFLIFGIVPFLFFLGVSSDVLAIKYTQTYYCQDNNGCMVATFNQTCKDGSSTSKAANPEDLKAYNPCPLYHCANKSDSNVCREIRNTDCKTTEDYRPGACPVTIKKGSPYFCKCSGGSGDTCKEFKSTGDASKDNCSSAPGCSGPYSGSCPAPTKDIKPKTAPTTDYLKKAQADAASNLNPAKFSSPTEIIAIAMKFGLGMIGLVTLALYIWAGFLWGTSKGNAEKTGKAVQIIMWTTIGVFTMLISYRAIKYIFDAVIK